MMIDLLDNSIPLTLDIYAILFRSGYFKGYLEGVVRIWVLFQRLRRHNYNKVSLVFLSDVFYWRLNNHSIANILMIILLKIFIVLLEVKLLNQIVHCKLFKKLKLLILKEITIFLLKNLLLIQEIHLFLKIN